MQIALIDDEKNCLGEMERLCRDFGRQYGFRAEIFPFPSGEAFLSALSGKSSGNFDIIFMDIYMPGMGGVAAAQEMRRKNLRSVLIFLTSSADFMPDAFSCHAFEYIVKPFQPERVYGVLRDAMKILSPPSRYMEIASGRKTVPIFHRDIISAVTDAHYLEITLADGEQLRSRMTLQEFIRQAESDPCFIPINKGIVVNAEYILDFEDSCCILASGARLPIRVRDRLKIEQAVRDYHFEIIRRGQRRLEH